MKNSWICASFESDIFGLKVLKLNALLLALMAILNVSCLGGDASEQVGNNSFGLRLAIVSGNGQISAPDELFENPAVVQVTDSSGAGVSGIEVTFVNSAGAPIFITNSSSTSNSNGLAQTSVRSPQEFNQTGTMQACIANSQACVDFEFGSNNSSENIKYELITENNDIETAGQPFSVTVRTVDVESGALVEFDGNITMQWTIITDDSWSGVSPTLLPNIIICTFVAGICDIAQQITLTDSRQFTQIFVGDGDDGFIDVFGQLITVNTDVPSQIVITDAAGGPGAGANTVGDTVYTADDPDATFFAAVTDSVGNYINDATVDSWTSSHPTQITANLTSNSTSATIDFVQTIPFPAFGYLFANVSGFPQGSSGQISIDPGVPVDAHVVPIDMNYTRTGGEEFEFDIEILDANGNIYGQQFGGTGYTGTFPVTFTFSNYHTGPIPSGGVLPMIHPPGATDQTMVSRTLSIPFFGGRTSFLGYRITFFDATSVNPEITASVDASSDLALPDVTGMQTYSMVVGPPSHLMLRDGLGASADTLCEADYTSPGIFSRDELSNILMFDYQSSLKEVCEGLRVDSGDTPFNIYASVEDAGGNFIDNLSVDWIYTDPIEVDSLLEDQMSGGSTSTSQLFTPDDATGGNVDNEWIRIQGNYSSVFYDQYFRARVLPGTLFSYDVRIRRGPGGQPYQAVATGTQTLVVVPRDEQGNDLTNSFSRDLNVTVSGTFNTAPGGQTPSFPIAGLHNNKFFQRMVPVDPNDNVGNSTAVATFTGLITPNAGDVVTVTVTDVADPTITDSVNWTVIPGDIAVAEIWKDNLPGSGGTEVTNTDFTITTDESTDLYAVAKDAYGNNRTVSSTWVTWSDAPDPFAVAGSVTGIIGSGTVQTPFNPQIPDSGIMRLQLNGAAAGSASADTGLITIVPGTPSNIQVDIDVDTFTAGDPRTVTASIIDSKGNIVDSIAGPTNLAITPLNNTSTRLGFDENIPSSGDYNFTAGQYTFNGAEAFTFYNSNDNPTIQIATTGGSPVVGQSTILTVNADAFDHLALLSANTQVDAGVTNRYTIRSEDQFGNRLDTGIDSTKNVTFNITSSLGDEDIMDSDLGSSTITNYALPGQVTISGELANGTAYVDVMSTKAGSLTVSGSVNSGSPIIGTNTEEALNVLPLTTISNVRFKSGEAPQSPSSTISPLFPFSVELVDAFNNVITTNNTDDIELTLIGASSSFGGYAPVEAVNGESVFSGLTYTLADTFTIRASLVGTPAMFVDAAMTVQIGSQTESVVILPNQTFTEGTGSLAAAVTGTPHTTGVITAGDTFTVEVRAVDSSFNTTTHSGPVALTSTDPYLEITPITGPNFVNGVATFNVRARRQGSIHNITATGTGLVNNASSDYTVNYGAASQLVAILPGQTLLEGAPDLATAIDQLVPDQTAGSAFSVEVRALDPYFNHVDNYTHADIGLSFDSDPAASNPSNLSMAGTGSATFSVTNFLAIPGHTVTPSTDSGAVLTGQTSETYEVRANTATQYIAVLPGQTHNPGQAIGNYAAAVTGTPTTQDTDSGFSVNMFAVDDYFNVRLDNTSAVSISTSDPNDVNPPAGAFASGAETFTVNPVTAGSGQTLTVTSGLAANTPASYDVDPGAPAQLIAIFTDYQSLSEGNLTLTGAVSDQTVQNRTTGESVAVRVYATDNKYNIVDDDSTSVSLTPSTANSSVSPSSQSLTNGQADFTVETYLVGSGYSILPGGGAYSQNASTTYNVNIGAGKRLLVVLPNQTFDPGQPSAALAAPETPFDQTQGSGFPFIARVYSTDDYYNHRTGDTDTVTITPSLAATITGGSSAAMSGGIVDFTLFHTGSGNAHNIQASAATFTSNTSQNYDVSGNLGNPTLALDDPTTSDTTYIRQASAGTTIGNDGTATRWCVSETQSSRPSSGTNNRATCSGGAGSDDGWYTARPSSVATGSSQGSKTLYVWTSDDAFNVSLASASDSITLDSIAPSDPAGLTLEDQSSSSTSYTNSATVDLNVTLTGDTVEWCTIEQPLINPPPTAPLYNNACWSTKPGIFPTPYTLGITGSRAVYVFAKDIAENVSSSYASASIQYDNAAPVFPGGNDILGARGGSDTVADAWLGTTTSPTIEWQAASDDTPVTYTLTIRDGGTPVCGTPTTGITGTSQSYGSCLTNGTTYTINLVATDSAEQSTTADNDGMSFTVDTDAPTAFTVAGANGGADSTADAYLTSSLTNPRLSWTDSTGETGYDVFITNDAQTVTECGVDQAAQDATSYQSFSGCTLSDNTDYKIRVIAFDQAGNQTEASNSPFDFRTTEGIDNFLVELVPASNPVAGSGFAVRLTARRANNETVTSYTGTKTINWTSNAAAGTDTCNTSGNMSVEYASTSLFFPPGGVATTSSSFIMKSVQATRTITATEQDTGNNAAGTSASFNVTAGSLGCVRVETAAGGAGSALGPATVGIDTVLTAYAAGYDLYGNYLSDQSVTWTGNGVIADKPYPTTGTTTTVVVTEAGVGQLQASGTSVDATITVNPGNALLTSTTTDQNSNNHLANNNVNAVFHWEPENDNSTAWMSSGGQSWASEATSSTRAARDDFPGKVHLVASNSGLDIIDESSNDLFMRFNSGSNLAVDSDLGNIVDVSALNGKIFLSMDDGSSTGGLIIIDLENDQTYQTNSSNRQLSGNNIANRNSAAAWSTNTTYPLLSSSRLNKIVSKRIGANDYVFIAESNGLDVLKVTATASVYQDPTTNNVHAVDVDSTGVVYYGEDSVGLHKKDLSGSLPLSANFSPDNTYTTSTNAELMALNINDISVAEGASSAQASENTIVIASDYGLTAIQEHSTFSSSTSLSYSTLGTGNNAFNGALSLIGNNGYVSLSDNGGLSDTATFELWFRPASSVVNKILLQKGNAVDGAVELAFNGSGNLVFTVRHNSTDYSVTSTSSSWSNNRWYHVAATISTTQIAMWIDGGDRQINSSMDFSTPSAFDISSANLNIGGNGVSGHFDGLIDELRVSDNLRYSSASFTVSSFAFFDDGNTEHLLHFDEASGGNADDASTVTDGSLNGDSYFVRPLYSGSVEAITNLDTYYSASRINTQFVNSGGWIEILDIQGSAYENSTALGSSCEDIKIYHRTSSTDNDSLVGRSSSGLQLRRN